MIATPTVDPGAVAPPSTPAAGAPPADPNAAPSTPASPSFDPAFPENWHLALGDEFADHAPTLSRFKSAKDLAQSYIHLQRMKPAFPGADATPDKVAEWRQLAGVPESPDGYTIEKPADFPEELGWDEGRLGEFKKLAHKHHVNPAFLQEALALDAKFGADALAKAKDTMAQRMAEAKDALITEWGAKFEENASKVRHITGRLAESAGVAPEIAQSWANDPNFAKLMLKVHAITAEDSTRTPLGFGDVRGPQQRANDIMEGKDPEWGERYRNGDTAAMQLVGKLLQEADQ